MNILKAILLGLIQGITEFLPVSSSGHLAFFKNILNVNLDSGIYFDVLLHLGTLVAIIVMFHEDIWNMIKEFLDIFVRLFANLMIYFSKKSGNSRYSYIKVINTTYKKLDLMVIISTIPTGILGIIGKDLVEKATESMLVVGICLMVTSFLLFISDRHPTGEYKIKTAPYSSALLLGISQGIATLPGISRSGATISTALLLGYNKKLAVRYSFIMSIPAVLGAVVVEFGDLKGEAVGSANLPAYIIGAIVAGVSGYFCMKLMLRLVKRKNYLAFSIYCLAIGLVSIIFSFIK